MAKKLVSREDYNRYMNSGRWREKRAAVLERDEFRCRHCGLHSETGKGLQAHHLRYDRLGDEPLEDLVTLCSSCHSSTHGKDRGLAQKARIREIKAWLLEGDEADSWAWQFWYRNEILHWRHTRVASRCK